MTSGVLVTFVGANSHDVNLDNLDHFLDEACVCFVFDRNNIHVYNIDDLYRNSTS